MPFTLALTALGSLCPYPARAAASRPGPILAGNFCSARSLPPLHLRKLSARPIGLLHRSCLARICRSTELAGANSSLHRAVATCGRRWTSGSCLPSEDRGEPRSLLHDGEEPDQCGNYDEPPKQTPLRNAVLNSLDEEARKLYSISPQRKTLQRPKQEDDQAQSATAVDKQRLRDEACVKEDNLLNNLVERRFEGPLSLSGILARHLSATSAHDAQSCFSVRELSYLDARGFCGRDIEVWAEVVRNPDPHFAAKPPFSSCADVPLFIILLLLGRRPSYISQPSLGAIMHHCVRRLKKEEINWAQLKTLTGRLVRHARIFWPETMPWIAQLFTLETKRIIDQTQTGSRNRDISRFCNTLLGLTSLPTGIAPFVSAVHQQKAQFDILRFMVTQDPPIVMARRGFQAMIKTQLAHQKTDKEREWARLKGTTWPPWIHERTAMDEGKDYHSGASRATRILHRMFEAGYSNGKWEDVAQMYAGWDTDQSPTIQTRTLEPFAIRKQRWLLDQHLWAARVATTRTRREAWACFLACEASGPGKTGDLVYRAMFEKLAADEVREHSVGRGGDGSPQSAMGALTPGDVKEVWPEPQSSLDLIHIAEPVPSWAALYQRMKGKKVKILTEPTLCSLLRTAPSWGLVIDIVEYGKKYHSLLDGTVVYDYEKSTSSSEYIHKGENKPSDRVLAAFVSSLCRHGHLSDLALGNRTNSVPPTREEHQRQFRKAPSYLLEYARNILFTFKPMHPPVWTAYIRALAQAWDLRTQGSADPSGLYKFNKQGLAALYTMFTAVLDKMQELGLNLDETQLLTVCRVLEGATKAAYHRQMTQHSVYLLTDGSQRIRLFFLGLTSAHVAPNNLAPPPHDGSQAEEVQSDLYNLPPHIPGPALLHAYVRALGLFYDYEGLYSFVTWAVTHHAEVSARAQAVNNGPVLLRRTLVALRCALQGELSKWANRKDDRAPLELMALIRGEIEKVEDWGGWPTDEEVEKYRHGRL